MRRAVPVLAVLAALAWPSAALAAVCPQTTLGDVEDEVMCTVCGTPLGLATEAPQANRERDFIRRRIERCESKDEVKAALAAEFGGEVLALPGNDGFDLAAYLVPGLALLAGLGAVLFAAMRWRGRRTPGTDRAARGGAEGAGGGAPSPKDSERLDTDLERYDL